MLRIGLVVRRRSGAGQLEDGSAPAAPAAEPLRQWRDHITLEELEAALPLQVSKIVQPARLQIVERDNMRAFRQQPVDEVRSDEAGTAGHEHGLVGKLRHTASFAACTARFVDMSFEFRATMRGSMRSEDAMPRRLPDRCWVLGPR